jgi:hypothetical protein
MGKIAIVATVLLACCTGADKKALDLSAMCGWTVIVAPDAIPSEQYAAEEFQALVKQAAGIELPIAKQPPKPTQNVFIGTGEAMRSSSVGFEVESLGDEGLRILIERDNIAIAGGRPRGTLYGVYEFMERYLGVRFLTFDHTYVPTVSAWLIPCEDFTYVPQFSFRWSYYRENAVQPDFAARLRVNTTTNDEKLGGVTPQGLINHSLYRQLPVGKYGKTHPEYFALVDGKRDLESHGGGPEPCVTHPDVIEIVARHVIEELDKTPGRKNISVSQNDNDAYCRCDRCEAINQREGTPMGSQLAFVNAVAERVEKKHPDVKIGTLAYWYTRKAPKTIRPRKNLQIQLCSIECCTLHAINDPNCERNREFCQDMLDWGAISSDIWVWNYNTNFRSYDLPFPNLRSISGNVKYFLQNNVKGLFMQANGNGSSGEMCDLRNYVISRCIWNPTLDSWELTEEFCELHYGKAAAPILAYLRMLHDNAEKSGCHPGCFPSPDEVGLRPKISEEAVAYFDKALKAAESDAVRARVEKASICAYKALLETCAQIEYKDGAYQVELPKQYEDAPARYVALCKQYNVSRAAETRPMADYIDRITRAASKKMPAERLENAVWRLTIVPEDGGKVVEMIHKPSGRNVLVPRKTGALGSLFGIGTLRERVMRGLDDPELNAFEAVREGETVILTTTLADGSVIERRIRLGVTRPEKVYFKTTITHRGAEPNVYQIKVIPHFHTMARSKDPKVLTGYVKLDTWVAFTEGWQQNNGPSVRLLNESTGAIAMYNHKTKSGILETYDPQTISRPVLWWDAPNEQANLELLTQPAELKDGESFTYTYGIEHLDEPPE